MVNAIQTKLWGYDLAIFGESREINSENPPYVKYHILLEMVCWTEESLTVVRKKKMSNSRKANWKINRTKKFLTLTSDYMLCLLRNEDSFQKYNWRSIP